MTHRSRAMGLRGIAFNGKGMRDRTLYSTQVHPRHKVALQGPVPGASREQEAGR